MKNVLDFEEERTEVELLGKINNILNLLDDVDKTIEELPQKQSNIELLRSDLEHLLEDKEMGSVGYKNIAKELEKVRKQRRHLKKAYEVIKCFQNNRNKITYKEQRPFVRNALETCYKDLQTSYNYRLLNAQNIKDLLGSENYKTKSEREENTNTNSTKRKKYRKVNIPKDTLRELLEQGLSYTKIGAKFDISASSVSHLKKKYFGEEVFNEVGSRGSFGGPIRRKEGAIRPREVTLEMYKELEDKGYNQKEMAEYWGFGASSVTDIKKRLGIEVVEKPNYHRG